jgi:uncharacterized protein YjiK
VRAAGLSTWALALATLGLDGGTLSQYDFGAPPADRWILPNALSEISGLAFDTQGRLFAHGDERAIIYQLDPATHEIVKRFAFGRPAVHGDFEAIAFAGSRVALTTSDGVVYVGEEGRDGESVGYTKYVTGVGERCEVEGLEYDADERAFLFACKTPRVRVLRGRLTVLQWRPDRPAEGTTARLIVPLASVAQRTGLAEFHPSELARDPGTGHFLLLAGRERAIIELTPEGDIVGAARLKHARHRQPEGLAFDRDGSLLVSDEANGDRATLTRYAKGSRKVSRES